MKKRIISMFFAVVMICGMIPILAVAEEAAVLEEESVIEEILLAEETEETTTEKAAEVVETAAEEKTKVVVKLAGIEIMEIPGKYNGFFGITTDTKNTPMGYDQVSSGYQIKQNVNAPYFSEGQAMVAINNKAGYIDTTGKIIIPIGEGHRRILLNDGLAHKYDLASGKYGYIDVNNTVVIPYSYDDAKPFHEGIAAVKLNGKYGFIDTTGKVVVPFEYDNVCRSSEGLTAVIKNFPVVQQDCTCEQLELGFIHDPYCPSLSGTIIPAKLGFIDTSGKLVIPIEYTFTEAGLSMTEFVYFSEGLAPVLKDDVRQYINTNNQMVINAGEHMLTFPFSEGLAMVVDHNNKCGFIDKSGEVVVPFRNGSAGAFKDGFALVNNGATYPSIKYGYINKRGEVVVPLEYNYASYFNEGYAIAQKDNQWYILRATGDQAQPTQATIAAIPTASTVLVNGENVAFDAYNIDDNNYFKLRDIAMALNGSAKQFQVGWDAAANAITLTNNKAYTSVGGELAGGISGNQSARPTTSIIYLDGHEVALTAYNIGGNNYFKLRDLAKAFDFGVGWDSSSNTITIDTSAAYTE